MTHPVHKSWRLDLMAASVACLTVFGCAGGDTSSTGGTGGTFVNIDGSVPMGCLAVQVPAEEPHLTSEPTFAAMFVTPSLPVEAEVGVDADARTMKIELQNVFFRERPPAAAVEEPVNGSRTFALTFPTEVDTEGMFFMEITLCPEDCDEERFVYTFEGDFPETYQRIHFERNTEVGAMETCIDIARVIVD